MRYYLIFLAIVIAFPADAQETVIMKGRQHNYAYIGFENPLMILAEGYDCDEIKVNVTNGSVMKIKDCYYKFQPSILGTAEFTIYVIKNKKQETLAKHIWQVIPLPRPVAIVGGYSNLSEIPKSVFKAQGGVMAYATNETGLEIRLVVDSFDISFKSAEGNLKFVHNVGNAFSQESVESIRSIEEGWTIVISSIWARYPDHTIVKLEPLEYLIR